MIQNIPRNESTGRLEARRPGSEARFLCPLHALALIGAALLFLGCRMTPPIVGLRPVSPPVTFGQESFWKSTPPRVLFERVDSVQPILKWEAFPGERDRSADVHGRLKNIDSVSYDLRIWEVTADGCKSALIYEREGLPQSEHRVEMPLAERTRYSWTIRARFLLNGRPRVTPWSFSQLPAPPDAWHYPRRIEETIPSSYFSFQTP